MPAVSLLHTRLKQIGQSLQQHPQGLALLGLGSAGKEQARMDEWSDLDFFAIVQQGHKQWFIDNLSWLSDIQPIAWCFKNTADGYKLLFDDGVFCEFAVFEVHELANIPYSEGEFVYRDTSVPENCKAPRIKSQTQTQDVAFLLGELLSNLYVGLCRFHRGERCSAMRFIQIYAFDRLVNLLDVSGTGANDAFQDDFCSDRRVEKRHAQHQQLFTACTPGGEHSPRAAKAMLDFVKQHYEIAPAIEAEIIKML